MVFDDIGCIMWGSWSLDISAPISEYLICHAYCYCSLCTLVQVPSVSSAFSCFDNCYSWQLTSSPVFSIIWMLLIGYVWFWFWWLFWEFWLAGSVLFLFCDLSQHKTNAILPNAIFVHKPQGTFQRSASQHSEILDKINNLQGYGPSQLSSAQVQ